MRLEQVDHGWVVRHVDTSVKKKIRELGLDSLTNHLLVKGWEAYLEAQLKSRWALLREEDPSLPVTPSEWLEYVPCRKILWTPDNPTLENPVRCLHCDEVHWPKLSLWDLLKGTSEV